MPVMAVGVFAAMVVGGTCLHNGGCVVIVVDDMIIWKS